MNNISEQQEHISQYSPFLYCEYFVMYMEENLVKEDATKSYLRMSVALFRESHEKSLFTDYNEILKTAINDSILLEYSKKVFYEEGKKIDLLNLLVLCIYVNELIREQYVVFLKQPTQQAVNGLGEISEITFKNKDGKTVTTNNFELIKEIMLAINEPLKKEGQAMETEKMGKIGKLDKMGSVTATRVLQCEFVYYMATSFEVLFPEVKPKHQGLKGMVTTSEQVLILRLMTFFDLYSSKNFIKIDNRFRTDSFRKMFEHYHKLMKIKFPSIDTKLSCSLLRPFVFIKYEDWAYGKDWFDPSFELSPITENDKIYYVKDKDVL